jgi:hypothetical protein
VVVENFCNNNKLTSNLVNVSVSKVSKDLKRVERECYQFHNKRSMKLVPLRVINSYNNRFN